MLKKLAIHMKESELQEYHPVVLSLVEKGIYCIIHTLRCNVTEETQALYSHELISFELI